MPIFYQKRVFYILFLLGTIIWISMFVCLPVVHSAVSPAFNIEPTFSGSSQSKGYFIYDSTPGTLIDDSIHVTNDSLVRDTIKLYAVDVTTGQTGGTTVLSYDDPKHDVGAWITLKQNQIILDPGKSQDVPFTVRIPQEVRPGQYEGAIIAEDSHYQQSTQVQHSKFPLKLDVQSVVALGVLINLPGPLVEHLNATGVRYDEKNTHQRLLLGLENTGTQLIHPAGSVQIQDDERKLLQNVPITLNTFIPQTSIDYPIDIQNKVLALGKTYTIQLHLLYEQKHSLNYSAIFLVPLPEEGPIIDQIQHLVTAPVSDPFSTVMLWRYALGLALLFLSVSVLFFWSKKFQPMIMKIITYRPQQKRKHLKPPAEETRVPVHSRGQRKNMKDET